MKEYVPIAGCDIEFVPRITTTGTSMIDTLMRAYESIGTKGEPRQLTGGGMVHRDNVFIEFSTPTAASVSEFCSNFLQAKEEVEDIIGVQLEGGPVVRTASWYTGIDLAQYAPPMLSYFSEFGCDPDMHMDAPGVRRRVNRSTKASPYREMGGHIHVELPYSHCTRREIAAAVRRYDHSMSAFLAQDRLEYEDMVGFQPHYRQPGLYREKSYGFEYRSLGSSWGSSPDKVEAIADLTFQFMEAYA
jgi:hypothetical protein